MNKNTIKIGRGFDFLAGVYDFGVRLFLGRRVERARVALLEEAVFLLESRDIPGPILIPGGGTGEFTAQLAKRLPRRRFICIDVSEKMLARTKARLDQTDPVLLKRVRFVHKDALLLSPVDFGEGGQVADAPALICSNFFLDLFESENIARLLKQPAFRPRPGGLWYVTDFGRPRGMFRRTFFTLLYGFFRAFCGIEAGRIPDLDGAFTKAGFRRVAEVNHFRGLIFTRVYGKL